MGACVAACDALHASCPAVGTWPRRVQDRLARLPPTVRHVVVVAAVPVIYPKIPVAESALQWMQGESANHDATAALTHSVTCARPHTQQAQTHSETHAERRNTFPKTQAPGEAGPRCPEDAVAGSGRSRNGVVKMLQKTGLADSLMTQFGTIDILDDLLDHWGAEVHEAEKRGLVHMMQALSLARGFRFTLLSGDVHVAAMGRFCSRHHKSLKHDHR